MSISRFLADLESRFDQERRDVQRLDVEELVVEERAAIAFSQRLVATQGQELSLLLRGGDRVAGRVVDVALTWVLIGTQHEEVLIPLSAIIEVGPLGRALPEGPHVAVKLSMASVLRRLAQQGVGIAVDHDAGNIRGTIDAVYADHLDMRREGGQLRDARDEQGSQMVTLLMHGIRKISVVPQPW